MNYLHFAQAVIDVIHLRLQELLHPTPPGKLSIDIAYVCRQSKMHLVRRWSFLQTPYLAQFTYHRDQAIIYYRPGMRRIRKQYAIAHALGHYSLTHGNMPPEVDQHFFSSVDDNREWAANRFALELLIPEVSLTKVMNQLSHRLTITEIAKLYDVTSIAMQQRLNDRRMHKTFFKSKTGCYKHGHERRSPDNHR